MPKTKAPKKIKSVKSVKKLAWKVFSEYVRRKQADWQGYGRCITCGKVDNWKSLQAGHFISRSKSNTLFNLINVNPQCYRCNVLLKGNIISYYRFMQEVYGDEAITNLMEESEKERRWTVPELEQMIENWRIEMKSFN